MVNEGRAKAKELEKVSTRIQDLQLKEKEYTAKIECPELMEKGKALQDEINAKLEELEKVSEEIKKEKLGNIPKEIVDEHMALNKERQEIEKELNKIGLKIEKFKAKYVPKLQKEGKKFLQNEYEDLESASIKGDTIELTIFSHLEEWRKRFLSQKK